MLIIPRLGVRQRCLDVAVSLNCKLGAVSRPFLGMLLIEDPTVTMKCRTAIKVMFLHFNLCTGVKQCN